MERAIPSEIARTDGRGSPRAAIHGGHRCTSARGRDASTPYPSIQKSTSGSRAALETGFRARAQPVAMPFEHKVRLEPMDHTLRVPAVETKPVDLQPLKEGAWRGETGSNRASEAQVSHIRLQNLVIDSVPSWSQHHFCARQGFRN